MKVAGDSHPGPRVEAALFAICHALAFWPGTTGCHPLCLVPAKKQEARADAQDGLGQGERAQLSFDLVPAKMGTAGRAGSEKPVWALEAKDKALGAITKSKSLSRKEPCPFLNPAPVL